MEQFARIFSDTPGRMQTFSFFSPRPHAHAASPVHKHTRPHIHTAHANKGHIFVILIRHAVEIVHDVQEVVLAPIHLNVLFYFVLNMSVHNVKRVKNMRPPQGTLFYIVQTEQMDSTALTSVWQESQE